MKKEIADILIEEADNVGIDLKAYEKYSGRGMYGKDTVGIVYEKENDLLRVVASAAARVQEEEREREEEAALDDQVMADLEGLTVVEFIESLGGFRYDNMGRSLIVY